MDQNWAALDRAHLHTVDWLASLDDRRVPAQASIEQVREALGASLGRSGVAELVERLCQHASTFAAGLDGIPGASVLNEVVFTQVCATFGSDERTEEVVRRLLADGTAWMTGSTWQGRSVLRISVSNWTTTETDVERSLDAVREAVIGL